MTRLAVSSNPIQDTSPLCTLLDYNPELDLDIDIICGPFGLFMQDFSGDGKVNLADLFFLLTALFMTAPSGDYNGDGTVDFLDLVAVAESITELNASGAPSVALPRTGTAEIVQTWINMAHAADDGSLAVQEGIANLKRFLDALRPTTTELLSNYPNPFNPETWIPYQLTEDAAVTVKIYDVSGHLIRTIEVGYKPMGYYLNRERAVYWNGQDETGESVGSGVYFYTFTAGDYTETRRLVILK